MTAHDPDSAAADSTVISENPNQSLVCAPVYRAFAQVHGELALAVHHDQRAFAAPGFCVDGEADH
jgi:hypothetical protein